MDWRNYTKTHSDAAPKRVEEERSRVLLELPPQIKEFRLKEYAANADTKAPFSFVLRAIPTLVTPTMADLIRNEAFRGAVGGQFLGIPYHYHSEPEAAEGGIRDRVFCPANEQTVCDRCAAYDEYRNDSFAYKYFKAREGRLLIAQIDGDPQLWAVDWPFGDDGFWGALNVALAAPKKSVRVPANWYTASSDVALLITATWDDSKGQKRAFWHINTVLPVRKEEDDLKFDPAAMDWDSIFPITEKIGLPIEAAQKRLSESLSRVKAKVEELAIANAKKQGNGSVAGTGASAGRKTDAQKTIATMDYDELCRYVAAQHLEIDIFVYDEDSLPQFRAEIEKVEKGAQA